jgi:hypothetical protein
LNDLSSCHRSPGYGISLVADTMTGVFDQCRMGYNTLKADGEEAMERNDLDLAEDIGL